MCEVVSPPPSDINRIHPHDRPVVASPLEPAHALIVQGPITETHNIALARPRRFYRGRDRIRLTGRRWRWCRRRRVVNVSRRLIIARKE